MKNIIDRYVKEFSDSSQERDKNILAGKQNLRTYCNLVNPHFFKEERIYQEGLLNTIQAMYQKTLINPKTGEPYRILLLNMPPGYGKSFSIANAITWMYGQDINNKVISVSYNGNIAPKFSKAVRKIVEEKEVRGEDSYVCGSFFDGIKIQYGDSAVMNWSLEGTYDSYLATSFEGTLTGMRGNIGIIDDPIKNAKEARNDNVKEEHWDFYKNTFCSRMLPGAMQIIVQTRWATDDLAGRVLQEFSDDCYVLKLTALDESEHSTCESLFPTKDLLIKKATLDEDIWLSNYMQEPIDKQGALYGTFKTYEAVSYNQFDRVINYTDTADEGTDYLCSISGGTIGRYGYVTDVYYTDEAMETTEPECARRLQNQGVRESLIESNNGGRGFARNVKSELKLMHCYKCSVTWFHQSQPKKARILTNQSNVMEQIIMPEDWEQRWPEFARHIKKYQRKGKNEHDDGEDALTGFVEFINGDVKAKSKGKIGNKRRLGV